MRLVLAGALAGILLPLGLIIGALVIVLAFDSIVKRKP